MTALARWCLRRRIVVIVLWFAAFAGVAVAAGATGAAYSNDYAMPGTESGQASALMAKAFPGRSGDVNTIVWHTERGTVRSGAVETTMRRTLAEVAELPGVSEVRGPYGGPGGDADGGRQISADGRTAYASLVFDRDTDDLDVRQVRKVVDTARAASGDGLQVELGGAGIALTEAPRAQLAELIGLGAAAVVLFLAFGSLAATFLPIVTAVAAVGTASAGISLLSHTILVADFAPMLGMLIGLGVGIDYALFIVTRHRHGLRAGLSVQEAAERAVAVSGRAVVFAGATVCIALLGMLILRLDFLDGVALAAALTVVLTVAAAVTLLPALLGLIGMRALGRRERRRLAEHGPRPERPAGIAARWSGFVERHPRVLGVTAAAVMLVLALPTFGLHLGTSDQGNNPAASTTRKAYDLLAGERGEGGEGSEASEGGEGSDTRKVREVREAGDARPKSGFGPGFNGPLTLVGALDGPQDRTAFDELPQRLRAVPGVAQVSGPEYDGGRGTGVVTVVPDSSPQSRQTSDLVQRLRTDVLPAAADGTTMRVRVGGITASYDDFASVIVGKLPLFVGAVIALGSLLLLLAFRSIGIPLKAALMNIAAVGSSFGIVVAIFQWGWGSELLGLGSAGPIEPFLPVIMVSVLFGLSMDYQVFLVSRMYEEWRLTRDNRRAVRVGLAETSRVINSAAVIMIAVFAAFILSGDRIIAMFGIGLAAAVALDAFVLRTLLVPALMHMLGGANWWLPAWLDRRLPRISIEPVPGTGGAVPEAGGAVPGQPGGERPLVGA
ncbi:hypothetical protein SSP35_01_09400 [Streptomyces sp. NBRC 110611]|uniref:MMPL family transporter n=1 Tax=Streptomyces sp. NBRC 110611 TaxID=1621259 RepID=UPI00085637BB|nr:MMPL family transporter [Streptomyces sp. NBRC 110611]GAU65596.1 hypothetical protein SSP35_01_09400 [Streptomyces sp. NBRC 110611]